MTEPIKLQVVIPQDFAGTRVDAALASLLPDYSRNVIKSWIEGGQVLLNGKQVLPKFKLAGNENVDIEATLKAQVNWHKAEAIALDIIYEDEAVLVINKPAGLVVHPAAGNHDGTLVNALLHHLPALSDLPRAGLIHRIDKETTGLLIIAKTLPSHTALVKQLQEKSIKRKYKALVYGEVISGSTINEPIDRHPKNRIKMAIVMGGRDAVTHYRVARRFEHFTLLNVELETGRTHQIRVHMQHVQHPIVGDPVYSRIKIPRKADDTLVEGMRQFKRQALHAYELSFTHPVTKETLSLQAKLPDDFSALLELIEKYDQCAK